MLVFRQAVQRALYTAYQQLFISNCAPDERERYYEVCPHHGQI